MEKLIDQYRTKEGLFNTINNHYIIPEILGFDISSKVIKEAKEDGQYIYHPNGEVYKYVEVLEKGFNKSKTYND